MSTDLTPKSDSIAIVGMALRFPGADNVEQFWRNLSEGVESISRFDEAELEDCFSDEVRRSASYVKARPILNGVDQFDGEFFGMHARECELTDPQHRVFLECAWEALEDGACDPARYSGAIGVFAGCSMDTYFLNNVCANRHVIDEFTSSYQVGMYPTLVGALHDFLATRVSYKLDLKGPSMTVQSACSTSLLAITQACQSLLLYQSDAALAGGVSITFPQKRGYLHQEGGMVSADGSCRTFDEAASGTIFGSGCGVVLLKRLEDAVADGNKIYAVIRGSGVNNDGAAKVGFTAPSADGQAAAIQMALAMAEVDARSVSYVECHGTATPLGDPIEIAGLCKAYRESTPDRQFCALGSVKTNVGHLDAAAGVAGLIKTALSLLHEKLPPSLHFRRANPQIDFDASPFYVNTMLAAWPRTETPRRAGVSAFGVGGTNVHVVLEEAPTAKPASELGHSRYLPQLLVLTARTSSGLQKQRANLAKHLRNYPSVELADLSYSLQTGRRAFGHRLSIVCHDHAEALSKLEEEIGSNDVVPKDGPLVFMFPGQGSQYPGMGRDLYEHEPVFRAELDRCAELVRPMIGFDLREVLYCAKNSEVAAEQLKATACAQPAIFAIEYATARLWMHWGLRPQMMIGHSVGEFVAAVLAGVFSLEDAMSLVAARGRMMQDLPGGAMLAVRLPESDVLPLLTPNSGIAAVNGHASCVASGPHEDIRALEVALEGRGAATRRLHTSHAFHSPMVDPIIEPLRELLSVMQLSAPSIPYVSCVTGDWVRAEDAKSPTYWAEHARRPVRFADGIATLVANGASVLLEVGPGHVLTTLALQATRGRDIRVLASLPEAPSEASDRPSDRDHMLETLGRLWAGGAHPDWNALHGATRTLVPLPTYPFERRRHWIDAPPRSDSTSGASPGHLATSDTSQDHDMNPEIVAVLPRASSPSPAGAEVDAARAAVVAILDDLSGEQMASANPSATFLELGFDSLFLSQVAQRLQTQFGIKITFRQLLGELSTIAALATLVGEKIQPLQTAVSRESPAMTPGCAPTPTADPILNSVPLGAPKSLSAMEGIVHDQLQAMSQLINRQLEAVQSLGLSRSATPPPIAAMAPAAQPVEDSSNSAARFQVYRPTHSSAEATLTPLQEQHIASLVQHNAEKMGGSKRLTQEFRAVLADPRAASGFRSEWKGLVYPIVCVRSAGSKIWDVDGNEYVDLVNGYGQTVFGHAPDFVVTAVKEQLDKGFAIGPQAELAGKVAALFCEITGNERATFCNTGSEAVMAAMRIARAVTGRDKVVMFNGDYHGQFDEVLVKGVQRPGMAPRSMAVATGIPASAVSNMVVLEYGAPASLQWIRENAHDLAAVVVEPVQSRHPDLLPLDFLRELRTITEASGTAFVMDEVVTGFRVHPGGMQALTGIRADLATYGKVVGGGLPIGILSGKASFMDALDGGQWQYDDDSFPQVGVTFFAGTFVRHPLALASCWAVLNHVKSQGVQLQERLAGRTAQLAQALRAEFAQYGLTTKIEQFSSWFYFNIHNEHPQAGLLFHHLRANGIYAQDGFPCFLTTAHSEQDLQLVVSAFRAGLAALSAVGIIGAKSPTEALATLPIASAPQESPLTESQTEIWLAAQLGDAASCCFNESMTLHLQGVLDAAALQNALNRVLARHDALRASFSPTGEEMHIAVALKLQLPLVDLLGCSEQQAQEEFAKLLDEDARTPFDLVNGPLIRATLVRRSLQAHELILTMHHIVCDGWSVNIIVRELANFYAGLCCGAEPAFKQPTAFSDYVRSQHPGDPAEAAQVETYWLKQFNEMPAPLNLPTDRPRAESRSFNGASRHRHIDVPLYKALKAAGANQGCTLFVTLLAAFQGLIGRLAGQEEVVVGVPTAGQSLLSDQILVGHCVNFLPIRGRWTQTTRMSELLASTRKTVLDAYDHQRYTLGTLVRKLAMSRQSNRVPLAEIQFNLERIADRLHAAQLDIEIEPNAKAHVNFDLFFNVIESDHGLRIDCDYNTDLFDAETIDCWLECYQVMMEAMVKDLSQPLTKLMYLPSAQRDEVMVQYNRTAVDYPRDKCAHELFEMHAASRPRTIAANYRNESLSYKDLNQRANQLAHHLLARVGTAVRKEPGLVAILVERSLDSLVAILATLKAGLAYLPLDPAHPPARLQHILSDAKISALISDAERGTTLVSDAIPVINLRNDVAVITAAPRTSPAKAVSPDSVAYVIYTSGSTGMPKGVEVSHRSLVNFLTSMAQRPGLAADDVLFAVTTVAFDIAALELLLPLTVGARVVIAPKEDSADGYRLLKRLSASAANVMQATPAGWRLLIEAGFHAPGDFKMLCGGEALSRELADRLLDGAGELWNMYGPTETTVWSSCARIMKGTQTITVGEPIANTQFYILDRYDELVLPGVPGQLHIGGDGVTHGYHGRPELTAEKFIANPFGAGRLYRTGDRARRLPDGEVQILGRMDHQIKLRGFRIEPGEIESLMVASSGVAEAVVVLREESPGAQRLVAYFVETPGQPRSPSQLRATMERELPDYMIPSTWIRLDGFPVSTNGKLDRASLPAPGADVSTPKELVPARTVLEATLLKIWTEVLHSDQVSTTDDVFDLGIDSIQLFQIASRANQQDVHLTVKQLMKHRTIVGIAQELEQGDLGGAVDGHRHSLSLHQFQQERTASSAR